MMEALCPLWVQQDCIGLHQQPGDALHDLVCGCILLPHDMSFMHSGQETGQSK